MKPYAPLEAGRGVARRKRCTATKSKEASPRKNVTLNHQDIVGKDQTPNGTAMEEVAFTSRQCIKVNTRV